MLGNDNAYKRRRIRFPFPCTVYLVYGVVNDTRSLQWCSFAILPIWAIRRLRGRLVARVPGHWETTDAVSLVLRVLFRRRQVFLAYRSPCTTPTITSLCWRSCHYTLKLLLAMVMQPVVERPVSFSCRFINISLAISHFSPVTVSLLFHDCHRNVKIYGNQSYKEFNVQMKQIDIETQHHGYVLNVTSIITTESHCYR